MIKLTDDYRIRADNYNFMLCAQRYTSAGEKSTVSSDRILGYYSTLQGVLKGYLNLQIGNIIESEKLDIERMIDKLDELDNHIKELGERLTRTGLYNKPKDYEEEGE